MEKGNVGAAMNLTSGIFTSPQPGTYFFSFSGISGRNGIWTGLYVNGNRIGSGFGAANSNTFAIHSTLHLNTGDQVSVQIWNSGSYFQDSNDHYTHLTGWLLEEDFSSL